MAGAGPLAVRTLLARFGSPEAATEASRASLSAEVGTGLAGAIVDGPPAATLAAHLEWLQQPNHHLVTLADAAFPPALLETADPPAVLFVLGRLDLLPLTSWSDK